MLYHEVTTGCHVSVGLIGSRGLRACRVTGEVCTGPLHLQDDVYPKLTVTCSVTERERERERERDREKDAVTIWPICNI